LSIEEVKARAVQVDANDDEDRATKTARWCDGRDDTLAGLRQDLQPWLLRASSDTKVGFALFHHVILQSKHHR
jgi:hypothetical protein